MEPTSLRAALVKGRSATSLTIVPPAPVAAPPEPQQQGPREENRIVRDLIALRWRTGELYTASDLELLLSDRLHQDQGFHLRARLKAENCKSARTRILALYRILDIAADAFKKHPTSPGCLYLVRVKVNGRMGFKLRKRSK